MDFEDNNPLGITSEVVPRIRSQSPPIAPHMNSFSNLERIVISDAGKSREGTSRGHIAYTVRVGPGKSVRRRYSEFESLRKLLRRLFPCIVVPPIPEKHSLGAYATNPAHAHEDARVIEHRKRTLAKFLNRCISITQIRDSWVLERFLDPNTSWREFTQSDSVLKLPRSPLQAPPVDPTSATPAHAFLPTPNGTVFLSRKLKTEGDGKNAEQGMNAASGVSETSGSNTEYAAREYERVIGGGLEKRARKINRHYSALAAEYADLGGQLNSFSLDSHGQFDKFAPAVEKVGQAVDQGYISTTNLVYQLSVDFSEPLAESVQMAATARQILKYRHQRELQVQIIKDTLERQTQQLTELQKAETEAQRMNEFLHADDRISAATEGLSIRGKTSEDSDRDHVVDEQGLHDRDHEIINEQNQQNQTHSQNPYHNDTAQQRQQNMEASSILDDARDTYDENSDTGDPENDDDNESATSSVENDVDDIMPTHSAESTVEAKASNGSATPSNGGSLRRGFKLPGFSHINQAIHGIMDVDPQTSRRSSITRLQERIEQLNAALKVAKQDSEVATREVDEELARYNASKQGDIRQFVKSFVKCHIEWAEKNLESWIEAKQAIANS